jgi:hypothetical protein
LTLLALSAGTKCCASANASPGGRMDRTKSAAAISASLAADIPAAAARAAVASLRPASEVSTVTPRSASLCPTAAPIAPAAITATTGAMMSSICNERGC